jgi:hypothetical protein
MRHKILLGGLGLLTLPLVARAADHVDSPAATAEPNADITDLYAWMSSDASKLNLVLDVHPSATAESAFSPAVQYAWHIQSAEAFGAEDAERSTVVCQFYSASEIECWLGDEYVRGDPSNPEGISSEDGRMRIFAGLRDDPFFFNLTGFNEVVKQVNAAAAGLTFDEAGCPQLDEATANALVSQLQSGPAGAPVSDTFARTNVLSIALELDKTLVNQGGPVLGVSASTHASP